jgi:phosphopantothenoylcysteine synthetase/decarboxylase
MAASLAGKRVLITSGPTRANLDAVRYISNRSTGRLGARIAVEALERGAQVILLAGPESAVPSDANLPAEQLGRLRILPVETVADLVEALQRELTGPEPPDAIVHAMAVLDYVPESASTEKTASGRNEWEIRLVTAPKVIRSIKEWAPQTYLVQFKLEVGKSDDRLREIALASLLANRGDLVVANDLQKIRDEEHPALIIATDGTVLSRPATKSEIARALCDILAQKLMPG